MSAINTENPPNIYESLAGQAPSAVPYWNTPVPTYLQNVPQQPPPYNGLPSTQVWNASTVVPQWRVANVVTPNTDPSSPFYLTFLKSKPRALGIVLIVSSILEIGLGIGLGFTCFTITLPSGIPFWGTIFYIIAGALTIAAQSKPKVCLVRGSLSLNIISSISSGIAIILNTVDLATLNCYYYDYGYDYEYGYRRCQQLLSATYALQSILLVINLLIFCISLSVSIFGCRSLSKISSNSPQVFLIQNDLVSMNPSTVPVTGFSQLFAPAIAPPQPPPQYVFQGVKGVPMS
ncbi:membrane-spanning 4-domains subfamily A member 4A-like isoform X1 [Bufo bufo]|uniref:membrane-spanning 4-domains subfamily A member 4A-like isoform X1 n=1 Tax=Bufo bufo TaxID=8384 RepID=UPI001ABE108D|nr:membrane-spanning 4-domains subfamily A member 4A-like isoform X1 [Bufo bufo]